MRWVAPRPQSNSSFCFPASTRILGPNRSMLGAGEPVPRIVTFRPCAGAGGTRPALTSNSKTPVHQGCLLGARFIGKSSPLELSGSLHALLSRLPDNCGYRDQHTANRLGHTAVFTDNLHMWQPSSSSFICAHWSRRFSMTHRQ